MEGRCDVTMIRCQPDKVGDSAACFRLLVMKTGACFRNMRCHGNPSRLYFPAMIRHQHHHCHGSIAASPHVSTSLAVVTGRGWRVGKLASTLTVSMPDPCPPVLVEIAEEEGCKSATKNGIRTTIVHAQVLYGVLRRNLAQKEKHGLELKKPETRRFCRTKSF